MYFRVRATLRERPGALALLAGRCGESELNILALQVFPDLGKVTDELVIHAPDTWTADGVLELVSGAGADEVSVEPCTTHDLLDQPARWLSAAYDVIADPDLLPTLLERLLGRDPDAWSATEHARAAALAALAQAEDPHPPPQRAEVEYDETGSGVLALLGGHVVGAAAFAGEEGTLLTIEVAPAWRRRGIGTALLGRAAVIAAGCGLDEVVLEAPSGDEGTVAMVCRSGLRARMRSSAGLLRVRIAVAELDLAAR